MPCLCKLVLSVIYSKATPVWHLVIQPVFGIMATLELYKQKYRYFSRSEVVEERREILHSINGDSLFPLDWWPEDMKLLFWKKPIGDLDTFKLVLFLLGNGCPPDLFTRWILLSQSWATSQVAEKRQVDFIVNNEITKSHTRFYFDIDHQKLLYLDGHPWKEPRK